MMSSYDGWGMGWGMHGFGGGDLILLLVIVAGIVFLVRRGRRL